MAALDLDRGALLVGNPAPGREGDGDCHLGAAELLQLLGRRALQGDADLDGRRARALRAPGPERVGRGDVLDDLLLALVRGYRLAHRERPLGAEAPRVEGAERDGQL